MRKVAVTAFAVLLVASSLASAQIRSAVFVSGLQSPVAFVQDSSQSNVQFVVEQAGRIRVVRDGVLLAQPFLDITGVVGSGGERGLLGMALAPDYAVSGRFFVNFTNLSGDTVIARFRRSSSDPVQADATSRFDFAFPNPDAQRFIRQPFSNHNGGDLHFGSDGYLYVALGDGGSGNDPQNNAQNMSTVLGKVLRLDVNVNDGHSVGYNAPSDNPFFEFVAGPALAGTPPPARNLI